MNKGFINMNKRLTMFVARLKIGSMSEHFSFKTLIMVISFCLCASLASAAESPQAVIQNGTNEILQILSQHPQDSRERRENIIAVLDKYFDFESMASLSLGREWRSLSPEQQQRFTHEFRDLLFAKYIGDMGRYASREAIYSTRPLGQGYVVVNTELKYQGSPASLDYYLHLRNGHWKVYDVAVQGMSLAASYRDQFSAIMANGSFEMLSNALRRQIARTCELNGTC
jgi:phospholipid transport system substrate-binding protein